MFEGYDQTTVTWCQGNKVSSEACRYWTWPLSPKSWGALGTTLRTAARETKGVVWGIAVQAILVKAQATALQLFQTQSA